MRSVLCSRRPPTEQPLYCLLGIYSAKLEESMNLHLCQGRFDSIVVSLRGPTITLRMTVGTFTSRHQSIMLREP